MKLRRFSLKDKALFLRYLNLESYELSAYAFQNIYIWRGLFDIGWSIIEGSLCIFFQDKIGAFLYLAPLGKDKTPRLIEKIFQILDGLNKNKEVSRIENVAAQDTAFYQRLGYDCVVKSYDYLCLASDLAKLAGDRFKSKRACVNYFLKHYQFEYLSLSLKHKDDCLELYDCWMSQRKAKRADPFYQGTLEDTRQCLKIALADYQSLSFIGRIVKVNRAVKAFTIGYQLNPDIFCILYEIADLSIKGLAQFIFRSLSAELKNYKYINIMDDSGLKNLKAVKLSYQPVKLIPAYIVQR